MAKQRYHVWQINNFRTLTLFDATVDDEIVSIFQNAESAYRAGKHILGLHNFRVLPCDGEDCGIMACRSTQ